VISPLLANVYLHYVLDQWAERWRRRHARGDMIFVRYADDYIAGFEHQEDGRAVPSRPARTTREVRPGTEGRENATDPVWAARRSGEISARPGPTGDLRFLGFTHISGKTRAGAFQVKRITMSKRMRAKLREVKLALKRRRYLPIPAQGRWLASVMRGHLAYYAVPGNIHAVGSFRTQLTRCWYKALRRRSQRTRTNWDRMGRLATRWLPSVRVLRPYPEQRFDARTRGKNPSAVAPHAGVCAGGGERSPSLPRQF